jgi:hypothetical protein
LLHEQEQQQLEQQASASSSSVCWAVRDLLQGFKAAYKQREQFLLIWQSSGPCGIVCCLPAAAVVATLTGDNSRLQLQQ